MIGPGRNASGGILVRFETADGMVKWRHVPDLTHKTLCRAGGLAEGHVTFDVASSFSDTGRSRGKRDGVILWNDRPIGRITIVEQREKFRDVDPIEDLRSLGCDVREPMRDPWQDKGHVAPPEWNGSTER